jgi:hypothetical protein
VTTPRHSSAGDLVSADGNRTSTIIDVAERQTAGTRAKDSDRNATCQVLDSALAEGRLSMEEHRQHALAAELHLRSGRQVRWHTRTVLTPPKQLQSLGGHLSIDPSRDPLTPGALPLRASVSSDFGSWSITFAGDGTVKRVDSATS